MFVGSSNKFRVPFQYFWIPGPRLHPPAGLLPQRLETREHSGGRAGNGQDCRLRISAGNQISTPVHGLRVNTMVITYYWSKVLEFEYLLVHHSIIKAFAGLQDRSFYPTIILGFLESINCQKGKTITLSVLSRYLGIVLPKSCSGRQVTTLQLISGLWAALPVSCTPRGHCFQVLLLNTTTVRRFFKLPSHLYWRRFCYLIFLSVTISSGYFPAHNAKNISCNFNGHASLNYRPLLFFLLPCQPSKKIRKNGNLIVLEEFT